MKILFLVLSMLSCTITFGSNSDSNIIYGDYDAAVSLSEQEDKPLLLIFSADWCGYCTKLKQDVLIDNSTKNYITCVIDTDMDKNLAKKHRARSLPTSVVLENNKETKRKAGYKNKTDYTNWLSD